jgi:hypothetical protein
VPGQCAAFGRSSLSPPVDDEHRARRQPCRQPDQAEAERRHPRRLAVRLAAGSTRKDDRSSADGTAAAAPNTRQTTAATDKINTTGRLNDFIDRQMAISQQPFRTATRPTEGLRRAAAPPGIEQFAPAAGPQMPTMNHVRLPGTVDRRHSSCAAHVTRGPTGRRPGGRSGRGGGHRRWVAGVEQRISLVTLGVVDVARARRFYERLGWHGQEVEETVFF